MFKTNTFAVYRGDTFMRTIKSEYQFEPGDKLHIAVMKNTYSKQYLYEELKTVDKSTNEIELEILPEITKNFPIEELLLEVELTTVSGIVKTNQYKIEVRADGIYERN